MTDDNGKTMQPAERILRQTLESVAKGTTPVQGTVTGTERMRAAFALARLDLGEDKTRLMAYRLAMPAGGGQD